MVPRVAAQGHSFKGASLYYLHDKKAKTKNRVAWTYTHNLPTEDPQKAFNWMAHTAMNADRLKMRAGVASTGRKLKAGTVYSFSLAWSPHQDPDKETMIAAVYETLGLLRLEDHQAVFVAHNDTAHPHVHVICNLIHPETGKKAVLSYDFLKMSQWAEGVERKDGEILCPQRVLNNEMRRNGKSLTHEFALVKHRDKKLLQSNRIQQLYDNAENSAAFQDGLKELGYTLAQGERRGFVLVDKNDKVVALARQLKGQRAADIRNRLHDIEDLPLLKDVLNPPPFDRDKYEAERQKKIVDAAIEATKESKSQEEKPVKKQSKSKAEKKQKDITPYDDTHLQEHDALMEWSQKSQRLRHELEDQQESQYQRKELTDKIKELEQSLSNKKGLWGKLSGKRKALEEELEALKKNLANIDFRIDEQRSTLEKKIQEDKPDFSEQAKQKRAEYIRRRMQERDRSNDIGNEPEI